MLILWALTNQWAARRCSVVAASCDHIDAMGPDGVVLIWLARSVHCDCNASITVPLALYLGTGLTQGVDCLSGWHLSNCKWACLVNLTIYVQYNPTHCVGCLCANLQADSVMFICGVLFSSSLHTHTHTCTHTHTHKHTHRTSAEVVPSALQTVQEMERPTRPVCHLFL